ncbi:unnamed protein product [Aphanomyces euteiches]|nr:hypothetical protein Ae201684P_020588 [Aphanomyces euteiches]KAH9155691.1 hypothetical protein AeRB84_002348 [Aphanomyces euteiches]
MRRCYTCPPRASQVPSTALRPRNHLESIVNRVTAAMLDLVRHRPDEWYKTAFRNVVVALCMKETTNLDRCVDPSSDLADRYVDGTCVRTFDRANCHDRGLCERIANCKWTAVEPNATTDRAVLFTDAQGAAAVEWISSQYLKTLVPLWFMGLLLSLVVVLVAILLTCVRPRPRRRQSTDCFEKNRTTIAIVVVSFASAAVVLSVLLVCLLSPGYVGGIHTLTQSIQDAAIALHEMHHDHRAPLQAMEAALGRWNSSILPSNSALNMTLNAVTTIVTTSSPFHEVTSDLAFPSYGCQAPTTWPTHLDPCLPCPPSVCANVSTHLAAILSPMTAALQHVEHLRDSIEALHDDIDSELASWRRSDAHLREVDCAAAFLDATTMSTSARLAWQIGGLVGILSLLGLVVAALVMAWIGLVHSKVGATQSRAWNMRTSCKLALAFAVVGFPASSVLLAGGIVTRDVCSALPLVVSETSAVPADIAPLVQRCARSTHDDDDNLWTDATDSPLTLACALDALLTDTTANLLIHESTAATQAFGDILATNAAKHWLDDDRMTQLLTQADAATARRWNETSLHSPWTMYTDGDSDLATCSLEKSKLVVPPCFMERHCPSSDPTCYAAVETAYAYSVAARELADLTTSIDVAFNRNDGKTISMRGMLAAVQSTIALEENKTKTALAQSVLGDIVRSGHELACLDSMRPCDVVVPSALQVERALCGHVDDFLVVAALAMFASSLAALGVAVIITLDKKRWIHPLLLMKTKPASPLVTAAAAAAGPAAVPAAPNHADIVFDVVAAPWRDDGGDGNGATAVATTEDAQWINQFDITLH